MKEKITIIKVGGKIVEENETLMQLLDLFAAIEGPKVLIHGGGRSATKIAAKLGIESHMIDGRRVTDAETLKVVTMVYGGLVNKSMIPVIIRRTGIPAETKANSITKEQRRKLLQELKCFEVSLCGTRPVAEAIVTSGGVKVGEIAPATMESKKVAGLYFAGELIDVDAYTGGFNLQIAWATGRAAGEAAATEGDAE